MELIDVVMKLVGPVEPVGETHTDDKRLDNLIVLRDLTRELLDRIESVAEASGGHMASVKVAKDCAASFLADVRGVAVDAPAEFKPDWANFEQGRACGRAEILEDVPAASEWLRLKQPETHAAWLAGNLTPAQVDWMAGWDACRAAMSTPGVKASENDQPGEPQ